MAEPISSNTKSVDTDTISFKFATNGVEIENWIDYHYHQDFLQPTVQWSFTIDAEEPTVRNTLVYGVRVNIYLNGFIQCAGIIELITTETSPNGGTILKVQGRDIMSIVVESHIDPKTAFPTNTSLQTVINTVLGPLGIGPNIPSGFIGVQSPYIYNNDSINLNVLTGKNYPPDPDAGFTKRQLKELQGQYGEGCWQFIDKLLKRQGFTMWALADGTGVVISQPIWTNNSGLNITHSLNNPDSTNILDGEKIINATEQPSMLYCKGFSNGIDAQVVSTDIIMVNELVAFDFNGNLLPQINSIIQKYQAQGVLIMPYRDNLIPTQNPAAIFAQQPIVRGPFFIKDKEATDSAQLQNYIMRTMAHYQVKFTTLKYRMYGYTQNGTPWAVNTLVNVNDDVLDIHEPYWVLSRTFTKDSSGGTITDLHLIKPYTLQISTFGGKGTTTKIPYSNTSTINKAGV